MRKTWCKTPSEIELIEKYSAAATDEERRKVEEEYDRECAEYYEWLHSSEPFEEEPADIF
jgi:hypothetical protein